MSITPLFYFNNINQPETFIINEIYSSELGEFAVRNRTEKGWTVDFIFNTSGITIESGSTFYYVGLLDETDASNYVDNNLSFAFTLDGKIEWKKKSHIKCSNGVDTIENRGETPSLCYNGVSNDFNITITFERNFSYEKCCDILNQGGQNDLFTGYTLNNTLDVVSGATPNYTTKYVVNPKWHKERFKRLGTLKIYLNGNPIYKMKNWEEIIPTKRQSLNDLVQIWGGGTSGSGNIHDGITPFQIKKITYYEYPLSYIDVRDNYDIIKQNYDIIECNDGC